MSSPWLTVLGIGADGPAGLGQRQRDALAAAEVLVGGRRHLAMLPPEDARRRIAWSSPLAATLDEIQGLRGRNVVVLATGDPLWHGIASLLLRRLPRAEVAVLPQISAFQEAAARLGWPLEDVLTLSVHGRPLERVRRHLAPDRRLLVLGEDGATPAALASLLTEAGYGPSRLWVLEELGGPAERVVEVPTAAGLPRDTRFAALATIALVLATYRPQAAALGIALPDELLAHDGQLTKREARALALLALEPRPGELLWDVGAGAGGIAIDWLRIDPTLRAVAIEQRAERATRIAANAARHGVPELAVVHGVAPACLRELPDPDAIFLGGGIATPGLLEACWARLRPHGRLVAHAVTLAGEAALLAFQRRGSRLLRVGLARAEPLGGETAWRPALPITQLTLRKPCGAAS